MSPYETVMQELINSRGFIGALQCGAISAPLSQDYRGGLSGRRAFELFVQRRYREITWGDMGRGAPLEEPWYRLMADFFRICLKHEMLGSEREWQGVIRGGVPGVPQQAQGPPNSGHYTPGGVPTMVGAPRAAPRQDPNSDELWKVLRAQGLLELIARLHNMSLVLGRYTQPR